MTTREKLAAAIRELATQERHERLAKKAEEGYYDDFLSPLAMPITQLVKDATQMGLHSIAERAKVGEFDATPEESRAWLASPEGQTLLEEFDLKDE